MLKRNQLTPANCSRTTGERLASSVASQGLVRLALKGREVSAAGGGGGGVHREADGGGDGGKGVFRCTVPLLPERCAGVGMGVEWEGADVGWVCVCVCVWGGGVIDTISLSLQNSFCKAVRAPNARWALPVQPVFEDKKSNGSDEKSLKKDLQD